MPNYMVFDIESIGLYGEGFAVGWVVVDETGKELASQCLACHHQAAKGSDTDRIWVKENVLPALGQEVVTMLDNPAMLRAAFWESWMHWKQKGAYLVADCCFPVETRFLDACVQDKPEHALNAPYPLLDVASFLCAAGLDPIREFSRLPEELPKHNPIRDARQSARIFLDALGIINQRLGGTSGINTGN